MDDFPSRRGPASKIVDYMKGDKAEISPIMADPEGIWKLGPNAYGKPATALNILRETVMGKDLFDYAFKEYSNRWMFKHPTPADFFRTMEDASGVDLDWFWRGWYYSTDHLDVAISDVREFKISSLNPDKEYPLARKESQRNKPLSSMAIKNRDSLGKTRVERFPELKDMYNIHDQFTVTNQNRNAYNETVNSLENWEKVPTYLHALTQHSQDHTPSSP